MIANSGPWGEKLEAERVQSGHRSPTSTDLRHMWRPQPEVGFATRVGVGLASGRCGLRFLVKAEKSDGWL